MEAIINCVICKNDFLSINYEALVCNDCNAMLNERHIIILSHDMLGKSTPIFIHDEPKLVPFVNPYRELEHIKDFISPLTKAQRNQLLEPIRTMPKILPNDKCPCGSGKKYKKCCNKK